MFDLAILTLAHREHLDDVLAGYHREVDHEVIRAWSLRCLTAIRWLVEHGSDPFSPGMRDRHTAVRALRGTLRGRRLPVVGLPKPATIRVPRAVSQR